MLRFKAIKIFHRYRKRCKYYYHNGTYTYCDNTGKICDEDYCPIIKKIKTMDEFINIILRGMNEGK